MKKTNLDTKENRMSASLYMFKSPFRNNQKKGLPPLFNIASNQSSQFLFYSDRA